MTDRCFTFSITLAIAAETEEEANELLITWLDHKENAGAGWVLAEVSDD